MFYRRISCRRYAESDSRVSTPVGNDDICKCKHHIQFCLLLSSPFISGLTKSKLSFYNSKHMLHLGADGWFFVFSSFDLCLWTDWFVFELRRTPVDFVIYLFSVWVLFYRVFSAIRSQISGISVDGLFFTCQKIRNLSYIVNICRCYFNAVYNAGILVNTDMSFVSEMPGITFLCWMCIAITRFIFVFRVPLFIRHEVEREGFFRQTKQKSACGVAPPRRIFVQYDEIKNRASARDE